MARRRQESTRCSSDMRDPYTTRVQLSAQIAGAVAATDE